MEFSNVTKSYKNTFWSKIEIEIRMNVLIRQEFHWKWEIHTKKVHEINEMTYKYDVSQHCVY